MSEQRILAGYHGISTSHLPTNVPISCVLLVCLICPRALRAMRYSGKE
jgi:hypothetical protein